MTTGNKNIDSRIKSDSENNQKGINLRAMWYWILLFLNCCAIAFFSAGCKKHSQSKPEAEKEIEVALPLVDSVEVYADYPANLVSLSEADVVAKVNGTILSRHYEEGSYVTKGQLLFTIESSNYSSGVKQANAQLESALSQLDYANKHYAALKEAFEMDAVSQMEVEQAHSSKVQAEAAVKSARAALDSQNLKLGYCKILAPISGKITSSTLDPGSYVSGEGNPVKLASIYDDNNLTVNFSIPEYQYSEIMRENGGFSAAPYKNFPVILSASPDVDDDSAKYLAEIVYHSPKVDPSTGSVELKAKIKNPGAELQSGMYGKVKLPVSTVANGILVNNSSISTDQRGKYLYTVNGRDEVEYTPVEVGELYHDSLRLITKGINKDTRYVTRAMINVRNGEKIKPILKK